MLNPSNDGTTPQMRPASLRAWSAVGAAMIAAASIGTSGCASTPREQAEGPLVYVAMETSLGPIVLELDREKAPISVENFLRYADEGAYDGTIFHRVMAEFVVQGGGYTPDFQERPSHAPIANEWLNGLKNTRGTIAMARTAAPDSATRQWYINVNDNVRLDSARPETGNAGYAVFGRVVSGIETVEAIRTLPVRDMPQHSMLNVPADPPVVLSVRRARPPG